MKFSKFHHLFKNSIYIFEKIESDYPSVRKFFIVSKIRNFFNSNGRKIVKMCLMQFQLSITFKNSLFSRGRF